MVFATYHRMRANGTSWAGTSRLLLLLSMSLLSHINIINYFLFLYVKTPITMDMGCHRIPFWPEQALRQLTDCLISLLIFITANHNSLAVLVARLSTLIIWDFFPSDTNIISLWLQGSLVPPSSIKYWRQMSSRFPIKYLSIAGAELYCMLEYLSPMPTASLSNILHLACCSNLSLVSRQD